MSAPLVPPRPRRAQAGHDAIKNESPSIPPRPVRQAELSPDRETFARSPLNEPPAAGPARHPRLKTSQDLPRRPPSVALPEIGHEGEEYASLDQLPAEALRVSSGEQVTNYSVDLPMHQPRASLPQSSAKKQVETVTGTDSTQATAAGIGRVKLADDVHKPPPNAVASAPSPLVRETSATYDGRHSSSTDGLLRVKASFNRSTPNLHVSERTTSRPASVHGDNREHGIPGIGVQVPLLQMAGDVQMPHAASRSSPHAPGIGFFHDGSTRAHTRKRSSRHEFGPPDVYGLHHQTPDQFEKEWIRKHPEEAAKEGHYLHLPKPESALTSEQLNRLVHQSEPATSGLAGTPDEHVADEYIARVVSAPQIPALVEPTQPATDESSPSSPLPKNATRSYGQIADALETDRGVASRRASRTNEDEHEHEHLDGTPILASDELLKRPSSAYMHAAVEPVPDSHHDDYHDSDPGRNSHRSSIQPSSRPSSQPNSAHGTATIPGSHGGSLHRFAAHEEPIHSSIGTPLEEIEEYEPLFPENETENPKKAFKKRPELAQHHFPSRDVWEDTPASLQYSATVSTPDLAKSLELAGVGSDPEAYPDANRPAKELSDKKEASGKHSAKTPFKSGVAEEMNHRPGPHRFPSSDIWEDSPDSAQYVATIDGPKFGEPPAIGTARPEIPTRPPRKSRLVDESKPLEEPVHGERSRSASPEKPKAPSIPSKPSIPSRPVRGPKSGHSSAPEAETVIKTKPPVPARPGSDKISAFKAGFMNDLNNRLKLGPHAPRVKKEGEVEGGEEPKAPLVDARKTRARGPPRRRQAAASPAVEGEPSGAFAFSPLINCWSIDETDEVQVHEHGETRATDSNVAVTDTAAMPSSEASDATTATAGETGSQNADVLSTTATEIASQIATAEQPGQVAERHHDSASALGDTLAGAGAAPAYPVPDSAVEGGEKEAEEEEVVEEEEEEEVEDEVEKEEVEREREVVEEAEAEEKAEKRDGSGISRNAAAQTGEVAMTTTQPSGKQEKVKVYMDGKAQTGSVVVEDGQEILS